MGVGACERIQYLLSFQTSDSVCIFLGDDGGEGCDRIQYLLPFQTSYSVCIFPAANNLSNRDSSSNSSSNSSNHHHTSVAATSLASQLVAALPPLLTANSQGQLLAVSPQVGGVLFSLPDQHPSPISSPQPPAYAVAIIPVFFSFFYNFVFSLTGQQPARTPQFLSHSHPHTPGHQSTVVFSELRSCVKVEVDILGSHPE